mmetsp:Transcript_49773/g.123704  ORF Transcript_49773/g.123704 Transcript_49773/m.123704 type:complete len:376 (-) Transcript_49773:103-1230(-)
MYFRYSATVVAPMHCSSPRASAGLSRLAASIAPSAAPAPTSVCSSSMKRIVSFEAVTSSTTSLSRCSNWPRYLVSATNSPSSSASTRFPLSFSGTVSSTIACASPSAIAVLPTPGSPMSTGLFLRRRTRICMQRRTSAVRPTIGSSCPFLAFRVRSTEHCDSVVFFPLDAPPAPTNSRSPASTSSSTLCRSSPIFVRSWSAPASTSSSRSTERIRSFEPISAQSCSSPLLMSVVRKHRSVSFEKGSSSSFAFKPKSPSSDGIDPPPGPRIASRTPDAFTPARSRACWIASACIVPASRRCSVPTALPPSLRASTCASMTSRIASRSKRSNTICTCPLPRGAAGRGRRPRRPAGERRRWGHWGSCTSEALASGAKR